MLKKHTFIVILIVLILFTHITYADDSLTDNPLSKTELEETIETSTDISAEPKINSRHAIVIDRNYDINYCNRKFKFKRYCHYHF